MSNKKVAASVRKALIQQEMVAQRHALKQEMQPIIQVSERLNRLFHAKNQQEQPTKKTVVVTGIALFLAILGHRRAGLAGRCARYLIVNYPGILRRFM